MEHSGNLYLHCRNNVVEISKPGNILDLLTVDDGNTYSFPESSLCVHPGEFTTIIGTTLTCREQSFEIVEFISRRCCRSLLIAALPHITTSRKFPISLSAFKRSSLSRRSQTRLLNHIQNNMRKPYECCVENANWRHRNATSLPFYLWRLEVLSQEPGITFHASSEASSLSATIGNSQTHLDNEIFSIVSQEFDTIIEIDLGNVHALRLESVKMDAEVYSKITVYDSFGTVSLVILIPGNMNIVHWARILDGI